MNAFRPIQLTAREAMQAKLHTLATMALEASASTDETGSFWHTKAGISLAHAIYDVTENDSVYDFAQDLDREFGGPDLIGDTIASIWGRPRV